MRVALVLTCLCCGLLGCGSAGSRDAATTQLDGAAEGGSDAGAAAARGAKLDLLFVVDDSSSMREEQAALRREFPRLIRKLISGDHDGNGRPDHAKFGDLHIGVVSSDVGAFTGVRGCEAQGDDGVLRSLPNPARESGLKCEAGYPAFIDFAAGASDLDTIAGDFACIAALGTEGCGFEQHLESALKALWPASRPELTFLGSAPAAASGRGDRDNAGFLRGSASTLGVVVIADEDDCSTEERAIFRPDKQPDNPYQAQPLNLRCHYNHDKAFALERYLFGLSNLGSRRVVFAALAGVPPDAVDASAQSGVDFDDDAARDGYYQKLLDDPRMQETLDGLSAANGRTPMELTPACTSALGRAYPARRLVDLTRRFGRDGLIRSICGELAPAIDQLADRLTRGDPGSRDPEPQPRATGRVQGWIAGASAADCRKGVVSAGAISRALDGNHFALSGVEAAATVSLWVRIPGFSLGHGLLPLPGGATQSIALRVNALESQPIPDPAQEQRFEFGPEAMRQLLTVPGGALATSFGTPAGSAAQLSAALLDARSAPGGMWVEQDGSMFRFRSRAMVEVRASQPGAALELTRPARLALRGRYDSAAPGLYRFDELTGYWTSLPLMAAVSNGMLEIAIDRFGIYAAGEPLTELSCGGVRLSDPDGLALAGAAVRFSDREAAEGTLVWAGPDGRACLPASAGRTLDFESFAEAGDRLFSASGELASGAAPAASCGGDCGGAEHSATLAGLGCAQGKIAPSGNRSAIELWLKGAGGAESLAAILHAGQEFCLDLIGEDTLRFAGGLRCTAPAALSAAGLGAGCGGGGCLELGTIQCCAEIESCGDGFDDDCDQRVDEGCRCGDVDCSAARAAHAGGDFCCTDSGRCGLRDRDNPHDAQHCFDIELDARNDATQCGDEIVDLGAGRQAVTGCCRPDQRCGLRIPPTDCVAREEAVLLLKEGSAALAAKSCSL